MNNPKYLVQVRCITYNHAQYITDAMNGFCIQKTNFSFVCTIIDDASTDGEQNVIRKYLEDNFDLTDQTIVRNEDNNDYVLTFARHKTNKNCYFAVLLLKYNHYSIKKSKNSYLKEWREASKYIALCEGDDYWTNPLKLQKQVDILENNTDCMMCCSNGISYSETHHTSSLINPIPVEKSRFLSAHEVFFEENALIPTCSMCYRKEIADSMPDFFRQTPVGDRPIRMWCAINGKIFYHQEPLIAYRYGAIGCYTQRVKRNSK